MIGNSDLELMVERAILRLRGGGLGFFYELNKVVSLAVFVCSLCFLGIVQNMFKVCSGFVF